MPDSNFIQVETPNVMPAADDYTRLSASVAGLDNGGYVVTYTQRDWGTGQPEFDDVYFQLYNADGTVNGMPVLINTTTTGHQDHSSVSVLTNGDFVVTWTDREGEDGDESGIYMQRFNSAGVAQGTETLVNTTTTGFQDSSDTFALAGGGYAVVWSEFDGDVFGTANTRILLQRYTAAGVPDGVETEIQSEASVTNTVDFSAPEIVELTGGNLAISWTRYDYSDDAYSQIEIVSSVGATIAGPIDPEQSVDDDFTLPQIRLVELGNGNVLSAYIYSYNGTGSVNIGYGEVYGRIYDSNGVAIGNEFAIATGMDNRRFDLFAHSNGDGGAIVGFVQEDDSVNDRALLAQNISQTGQLIGDMMWLNQNHGAQWRSGEIGVLDNGDLVAVHQDSGQGARSNIWTQIIANGEDVRFSIGDDTVVLSNSGEQVAALEGADDVTGGTSDDVIAGGSGIDIINGGDGSDTIDGGSDGDTLNGQVGDDFIFGRAGADTIFGEVGEDLIDGGTGDDTIIGGDNNDTLIGGYGSDSIFGGEGDDLIEGFRSEFVDIGPNDPDRDVGIENYLYGEAGEDYLYGGDGTDWMFGGSENDRLIGNGGTDYMYGEGGADILNGGDGIDYMWGGDGGDTFYALDGNDWLRGEQGFDRMNGGNGDDVLIGGDGNDTMNGDADTDTFYGEADDDVINGGDDGDVAFGQDGNDRLNGDAGGDFLFGGIGMDTINGGTENDLMWGDMPGTGDGVEDIFVFEDNWGFDAVYDFELGIDTVAMGSVTGLTQFSDLNVIDGGVNVTVLFGADAITFYGVTLIELNANQADFDFS